jgi:uncharacterized membrane protein
MEGLITLLILALIVILLAPLFIGAATNAKIKKLSQALNETNRLLHVLLEQQKKQGIQPAEQSESFQSSEESKEFKEKTPIVKEIIPLPTPVQEVEEKQTEVPAQTSEEDWDAILQQTKKEETILTISTEDSGKTETPIIRNKPKTNLEQFIGEKLVSILGIGILVLGIVFMVKWAVSRQLISDAGKILIGIGSGVILLGFAHRLREKYRAFSSILAGGGIAVLYFAIYQAYQAYHLLPQTFAFVLMVLITLLAVIMSIYYDKKELAILALLGGFCTPFLVSNGSGNFQILFTYLLILNAGMFVLAAFKRWAMINVLAYGITVIIFGVWMYQDHQAAKHHSQQGFIFATLFFLTFFGMNLIYHIRFKKAFKAIDFSILLSNTLFYFGAGLFFLYQIGTLESRGLFTIALAVFHFIFAYGFFRNRTIDKNLIFLLIGLVLTFISLVAPILLEGNFITLFWACEMVLLYWLGKKSGISLIRNTSVLVMTLCVISIIMDWNQAYFQVAVQRLPILLNKAFVTTLVVSAAFGLIQFLYRSEQEPKLLWGLLPQKWYGTILKFMFLLVLFTGGWIELRYQLYNSWQFSAFTNMCTALYSILFMMMILLVQRSKSESYQGVIAIAMSILGLLSFLYANIEISKVRNAVLFDLQSPAFFYMHGVLLFAYLLLFVIFIRILNQRSKTQVNHFRMGHVFALLMLVFILSAESTHLWVWNNHEPGFAIRSNISKSIQIAWPILWSIISFVYMFIGMKYKVTWFRFLSLGLFCLTILKLFIHDISNVSQGGKIAAFIILGVLLLIVSFMYQKIKGLFTES